LREECGYDGAQPYWEPPLDVYGTGTANSPIFDAVHGFGGNGAYREGYAGPHDNLTFIPGFTGGDMVDRYSSPGDPLFFLHHANLDRVWWQWQEQDLSVRMADISELTDTVPPYENVALEWELPMSITGPRPLSRK